MARNDNAVITPAKGYVFTAPVGTNAPTPADISAFDPAVGITSMADDGTTTVTWDTMGHTSRDELPVFGFDGGETETRGTWQNATLREVVTEVASDYVTFNVHQFDDASLGLYYSVTDSGATTGVFQVKEAPTGTVNKAILIIIVDGDISIGFHAPKVSVRREESIEMSVDELAYMPLRATFLKDAASDYLFAWISEDTGLGAA